MKKLLSSVLSLFLLSTHPVFAGEMDMEEMTDMKNESMSSTTTASAPMNRDGSGTAWLPDSSPMHAAHFMTRNWSFMLHGSIFGRYIWQNPFNTGKRGGNKFDAPNWFMLMAQTPILTNDRLTFKGMFSLDALIVGGAGYPLLFQTGESWQSKPLIDAQHPHDLFSELSVTYSHAFNEQSNIFGYLGFPGEPALGPTAFMHRPSAYSNPDAPIGHHWQDATHITFGVGTLGFIYDKFKIDGSIFTGREPDENRFNFDMPRFDSYSGRLSYNPTKDLSAQASFGYLKSPEALSPDENVYKATASVSHNKLFNGEIENFTNLATTLVWGMNVPVTTQAHQSLHSVLLESELQFIRNNFVYTKLEYIQKDDHELVLNLNNDKVYNIFAWTIGASRNIVNYSNLSLSAGAQTTLYFPQAELEPFYGKFPVAFEVFLRLAPDIMNMKHEMKNMDMKDMEQQDMKKENPAKDNKQENMDNMDHMNMPGMQDNSKENTGDKKPETQPQMDNMDMKNMDHNMPMNQDKTNNQKMDNMNMDNMNMSEKKQEKPVYKKTQVLKKAVIKPKVSKPVTKNIKVIKKPTIKPKAVVKKKPVVKKTEEPMNMEHMQH